MKFLRMGLWLVASLASLELGAVEYWSVAIFPDAGPDLKPKVLAVPEGMTWEQLKDSIVLNNIFGPDTPPLEAFKLYHQSSILIPPPYVTNIIPFTDTLFFPSNSDDPIDFDLLSAIQEGWLSPIFEDDRGILVGDGPLSHQIDGAVRLFIYSEEA